MHLLVYHVPYGQKAEIFNAKYLPRVGDKIDLFCEPFPTIDGVIVFPSEKLQKELNVVGVDAIIYVK